MTASQFFKTLADALLDTLKDSVRLLPFLFIAYLLLEVIEHAGKEKTENLIRRSGKAGPIVGALTGIVPQCGFSAMASQLYAGHILSLGTLVAVFLSASDEMLPVLIAEGAPALLILKLIGFKVVIGMAVGLLVDVFYRLYRRRFAAAPIADFCEREHCHCEKGVFLSALHHTVRVFLFILAFSFVLNALILFIGEEKLTAFATAAPTLSLLLSGLIGLIPNCASSVILTELYLGGIIGAGAMLAGLLAGSGVGIMILFRVNRPMKENFFILGILYLTGVIVGSLVDFTGLATFFA